jgi:UDP-N-acetylglucosamine 1-carboxyvinyltransferase
MIAAAATKGDVTLNNVNPYHLSAVIQALEDSGCDVDVNGDNIRVIMKQDPTPVDITTAPYPGYPTDAQAQWAAYMLHCTGAATVRDTIYPTRFGYVPELVRLGADVVTEEGSIVIRGGTRLSGATVMSSDLRASASLVIAALMAEGSTEILRVYHIDRGYESIEKRLTALGATIKREQTEEF